MVLCDDLGGWNGWMGGRLKKEGICVFIKLIHFAVHQKLTMLKRNYIPIKKKIENIP